MVLPASLPSAESPRRDGRLPQQLRPVTFERCFTRVPHGSVLARAGQTMVLCTASVEETLPPWMQDRDEGWLTAEYNMLPGSTAPRKPRERAGKLDGRTTEIQRLIGRSLRAVVDRKALGPRTITIDCDVLQADGGTRTLCITAGFVALVDALAAVEPGLPAGPRGVLTGSVAAVSLGIVGGRLLLDLDYSEDSRAEVDANIVMTGDGRFVEIQATAEGQVFTRSQLAEQLELAMEGIRRLTQAQRAALGAAWPASAEG